MVDKLLKLKTYTLKKIVSFRIKRQFNLFVFVLISAILKTLSSFIVPKWFKQIQALTQILGTFKKVLTWFSKNY